ncbi:hypothetical protein VCHA53O466_140059 [Vibrio chagasii]|nr:hypothetical protein VCHA53O466_140059 [Vibrio chagasii]
MTNRISIEGSNIQFSIVEGDLHAVNTEDGVGYYPISWVTFIYQEAAYVYPTHFLAKMTYIEEIDDVMLVDSRSQCQDLIDQVKNKGSINLDKWTKVVPEEVDNDTLEQRWAQDYIEERRGY